MSDTEVRIGRTIDEATKFAFGNLLNIIKVGWLPLGLTLGILAWAAWTFWQPLILAYIDFFEVFSATMDATVANGGGKAPEFVFDEALFEAAFTEMGLGNFVLGYAVLIIVGLIGFSIPIAAYCRMMVLGEHYGGPIYLRLGPREINVALTYLAITVLMVVGMLVISGAGGVLLSIVAGMMGDGAAATVGLFGFAYFIVVIVVFFWLFARLGLALPIAATEGGIPIGRAWQLSKGAAGKIAWGIVLGYLVVMVFSMIFMMVLSLLTGILLSVLVALGSQMAPLFVGGIWVVGYIAFYSFSTAFFVALLAGPYKRLTEAEG